MKYHIFIDSNNRTKDDLGNYVGTPSNFYYNIQGFLPILDYSTYVMHVEYVLIFNNQKSYNILNKAANYKPYFSFTYNIMANLGNQSNILSNDSYINIFSGSTENFTRYPYYDGTLAYDYVLMNSSLEGREGPKIVVSNPKALINIQVLNEDGGALVDIDAGAVPRVRMLLEFKPFI